MAKVVVELAKFSYSNANTLNNEAGQDIEGLRSMVVHFVVCVFETYCKG